MWPFSSSAKQAPCVNCAGELRQLDDRLSKVEDKLAAERLEQLQLIDKITRRLQGRIAKAEEREAHRAERPPFMPAHPRFGR